MLHPANLGRVADFSPIIQPDMSDLIAIRESLTYDRVDIEPVPDRTLENSRVELEQTSDQTEKEKNVHKADGKAKVIFQKAIEHFFPDLAKIKEYRQVLAKKKVLLYNMYNVRET